MESTTINILGPAWMSNNHLNTSLTEAETQAQLAELNATNMTLQVEEYNKEVEKRRAKVSSILGKELTTQELFELSYLLRY